jgi:MoxR-like ATPase
MNAISTSAGVGETSPPAEKAVVQRLRHVLNNALRGKPQVIEYVLACLLARGHILLEDKPGWAKPPWPKPWRPPSVAALLASSAHPTCSPGDITGFNIFNQKTREFEFQPGPVFADVLLVDEINRTTPRTQSALLEG